MCGLGLLGAYKGREDDDDGAFSEWEEDGFCDWQMEKTTV